MGASRMTRMAALAISAWRGKPLLLSRSGSFSSSWRSLMTWAAKSSVMARRDIPVGGGVMRDECAALYYGPNDDPPAEEQGNI